MEIKFTNEDDETRAAITKRTDEHNASLKEGEAPLTPEQYCEFVMQNAAQSWVKHDYESTVRRLGDLAAEMSYQERQALIEQVEKASGK